MHFHKYLHPANFEFPRYATPSQAIQTNIGKCQMHARACGEDIYNIQITGQGWEKLDTTVALNWGETRASLEGNSTRLVFAEDGTMSLESKEGEVYLTSSTGRFFGQSGRSSLFEFVKNPGDQFFGMGEKWTGFEHSGRVTKFWNTDVWADFHPDSYLHGRPAADPVYVSIPYLIIKRANTYVGLLLNNPHATYISTGKNISVAGQKELENAESKFHLGAEEGQPNLCILFGPSLPELTRKFQRLVGVTPLPPAWALGYHQCRWGYKSEADLQELDRSFVEHEIPVDGLWLDIDYMDKYKVFTFDEQHFPNPSKAMAGLNAAGRKVIPILDPGVKFQPGYAVYDHGKASGVYCQNPQKQDYVGLVWPGETVFPDYSLKVARDWWADETAKLANLGIYGAWLDMNDPATGPVDNQDMLFQNGVEEHSYFHNQYALGMAIASRQGFLQSHPGDRPFLLCRSGCTGSNRYTAIWTGDNYSNYYHLKNSIPVTLNLALSGIPFNGADVGGFGGDTNAELMTDWYKAAFLFPVMRNHTTIDTRQQEPWAFGEDTLTILRKYIRLRYRLRPYLYQLFIQQERTGEAILRPLFYDFEDTQEVPLGLIDDQFMVGPSIMQAPFVQEKQLTRHVTLPGACEWYSLSDDKWLQGNRTIALEANLENTPIFVRDGSILPLARIQPNENAFRGGEIDFHFFLSGKTEATVRYTFDDGQSFAYQNGTRSEVEIRAVRTANELAIEIKTLSNGFGAGSFTFTTAEEITRVTVNGIAAQPCPPQGVPLGAGKTMTWIAP